MQPGMARPRKGQEIGATCRLAFRVTPAVRAGLEQMAARNGRSLTDEVRAAVEAHVGIAPGGTLRQRKRDLPPDPQPIGRSATKTTP